jgi:uncharacterized spore protein YtfJ
MARTDPMEAEWLTSGRDVLTVKRVFGDPMNYDGMSVIPVARLRGGSGGGAGTGPDGQGSGRGGGFGMTARPAGVFVVNDVDVEWKPAVNRERTLLAAMALVAFVVWVIRSSARRSA